MKLTLIHFHKPQNRFHSVTMPSFSPHTLPLYRALVLFSAAVSVHSHAPTLAHLLPSSFQPHCSIVSSFSAHWTDILVLFTPRFFFPKHVYFSLRTWGEGVQHCNTAAGVSKADAVFASFACMVSIGDHRGTVCVCAAASPESIATVITPMPPCLLDQMFSSSFLVFFIIYS